MKRGEIWVLNHKIEKSGLLYGVKHGKLFGVEAHDCDDFISLPKKVEIISIKEKVGVKEIDRNEEHVSMIFCQPFYEDLWYFSRKNFILLYEKDWSIK